MQQYDIEIKNEKIRGYKIITFLLVLLSCSYYLYLLFDPAQRKNALISLGFVLVYILYRFYKLQKKKQAFFFDEWIYFLLMLLWVNNYLIAVMFLILFLSYTISLQKIIYTFTTSVIKQKNFPWKKHQWEELTNVILKDNLLTIDFKSNKLMQAEIINDEIDEADFNAFVKKQVFTGRVQND